MPPFPSLVGHKQRMLQLLRIPNLLIVALTQYLLQYLVLAPALREAGLRASLGSFHFFLLVVTTVLLAAGGYVINDILDYKTDLINKPEKMAIGKYISKGMAKVFYGAPGNGANARSISSFSRGKTPVS